MLIHDVLIPAEPVNPRKSLKINHREIIDKAIFFDLEHYLYKEPICIGVFGAATYSRESQAIHSTQYMIENQRDAREILKMTEKYFRLQKVNGMEYIVTFSGNNDFMVINHLFHKYEIDFNFEENFILVDLQKEYEHRFHRNIGLKNLERLFRIERHGELISGMTLAKTFSKIIKDRDYIARMPREKILKILNYNEQDVVNLYNIMNHWEDIVEADVVLLEEILLEEKLVKLEKKRLQEEARQDALRESLPQEHDDQPPIWESAGL